MLWKNIHVASWGERTLTLWVLDVQPSPGPSGLWQMLINSDHSGSILFPCCPQTRRRVNNNIFKPVKKNNQQLDIATENTWALEQLFPRRQWDFHLSAPLTSLPVLHPPVELLSLAERAFGAGLALPRPRTVTQEFIQSVINPPPLCHSASPSHWGQGLFKV